MPSINLDNLERYDSKARNEAEEEYMPKNSGNWQKTEEAGAVAFYPVGGSPLEGTVKFSFTETPPASGNKGPDNPSTIAGVSSVKVTRCGKNLLPSAYIYSTMANRGITVSYNADKSIHLKGTASSSNLPYMRFFTEEPGVVPSVLSSGTTVTISLSCPDSNVYGALYDSDSPALWGDATIVYPGTPVTHTISANAKTVNFSLIVTRSAVVDCDVYCQIEFGQTATAWEAPADEDYAIPLNGTYYGGTLDVASGVMTVTHFLEQLSSSTNIVSIGFSEGQSAYRVGMYLSSSKERMPYPITSLADYACNSFPVVADPSADRAPCFGLAGGSILTYLCLTKAVLGVGDGATYDTVRAAVLSFLGSHQVKVAGKFATPYTVQLTPTSISALTQTDKCTPRLNTVYTDADTIQIGYMKSLQRTEQEITQALLEIESNSSD